MKRIIKCFLLNILFPILSYAQVDSVYPGSHHLTTSALKPGLRQYLVYFQRTGPVKNLVFWYWMRDIAIETRHGMQVYAIRQHWFGSDSSHYRALFSLNAVKDFAPVYHCETVNGKTSAYNWNAANITGADTVAENVKKGFDLPFARPNLNWNLDIETFEMLPLAAGKTFAINFYDAGLDPPKFTLYKVTGSEKLTLLNNETVDCWKLFTAGTSPNGMPYSQTFWISKEGHEFLKEEDVFNNNMRRYKIKLFLSATLPAPVKKNEVFVLATLYKRHSTTPVYNLDTLQKIIRAIDPDVFVLDVTPTELKEQKVFPSKIEYPGVIFPLVNNAKSPAYAAEPAEPMFTEIVNALIAVHKNFRDTQPDAAKALELFTTGIFEALKASWQTPADVNSAITDKALAGKRALEDKLTGPVAADGELRWTQHIVQVTLQAAEEHPGKRILVLIGVENCHGVRAALGQHAAINLVNMEQWLHNSYTR